MNKINNLKIKPLVSIGMPVKNGFINKHSNDINLTKALNSVLSQSYKNIEIIISNNCSTDETKYYLEKISKIDKRIKLHNQKKQISSGENFQYVLDQASGKYFKWNAADDLISEDYIEKNVEFLEINSDYLFSSSRFYYEDRPEILHSFNLDLDLYNRIKGFFDIRDVSHNIFYSLIRREIMSTVTNVAKDYWAIDWIINLELLLNGKFKTINNGYVGFGVGGVSRQTSFLDSKAVYIKKKIYRIIPFYELMKIIIKKITFSKKLSLIEKFYIYFLLVKINLTFHKRHSFKVIKKLLS